MKRFIAILILAGLAAVGPHARSDRTPGPAAAELPAVLVVLDAPSEFDGVARELGFRLVGEETMGGLGISAKTVFAPLGQAKAEARKRLLERFPGLIVGSSELDGFAL